MTRGVLAVATLVALLFGAHEAFAGSQFCILDIICLGGPGPGPGPHPAPAPLLAAGIPAFTALGGGVLVTKLYRKFKRRA